MAPLFKPSILLALAITASVTANPIPADEMKQKLVRDAESIPPVCHPDMPGCLNFIHPPERRDAEESFIPVCTPAVPGCPGYNPNPPTRRDVETPEDTDDAVLARSDGPLPNTERRDAEKSFIPVCTPAVPGCPGYNPNPPTRRDVETPEDTDEAILARRDVPPPNTVPPSWGNTHQPPPPNKVRVGERTRGKGTF